MIDKAKRPRSSGRGAAIRADEGEGRATCANEWRQIERAWRDAGLMEAFLGNGGTNHRLYHFVDKVRALGSAQAEAEVARLTVALAEAEATASLLHKDNERLRWRHPAVLPDWNDLPDGLRIKLAKTADYYDPDWGATMVVDLYGKLRQDMMEAPHDDK